MNPARGAVVASAGADLVPAGGPPGAASGLETVSATRGGVQLLVAAAVSLLANYLFLLGSGRLLGAADYGTLAALTGLLTVVLLPTGALQMAASREISRREALGEHDAAAAFSRALLVLGLKLAVPLLVVALALLVPLRELLRIDATAPVALALTVLGGVFVYPTVLGVMQGQQRFRALAFNSAAPMVLRLVLLVVLAVAGLRLYGALGAITVSAVFAVVLGLITIRGTLRSAAGVAVPSIRPFLRYLVPVAVGLFGIAVLTNADIIVVKARFSAEDAGVYAAASAFARVAFFLPSTILAVVFPRTAARQARGEQSADILGRSVIVTVGFCAVLAGTYALVGSDVISLTFGAEFAGAAELLVPFCLAMTCFSVLNVLLGYHLSRGESRFAWIVAGSVVVQLAVLATVPGSLRGVLWVDLAVGVALLVAHELTMGSSAGAIAAGYRRFGVGHAVRRAAASVVSARGLLFEAVVVLAGYWLLALAVTWPLVLGLGDTMPGPFPNDGTGTVAWFWQLQNEGGYSLLGTTHHILTGAPLGWDQGSALNFQWLLPYYPTYLLAGVVGEVAAVNLAALAGLAFSGAAMYLLVRYLGCGRLVATWAGVVYLSFPWILERVMAGHASLVHIEVFPLLVLASIAWVRRPTDGRAALVALVVTAAWLTSGYFGAMSLIALVGVTCVAVLVNGRSLGWFHAVGCAAKLWAMAIVAGAGLLLVSVLAGGGAGVALGRDASEVEFYGAHLRDYLPDPANPLLGGITEAVGESSIPYYPGVENMLYPGALTLALALLWVGVAVFRRRQLSEHTRVATMALAAVTVVAVVFAAPGPMHVGGLTIRPMPSFILVHVLPSFRVPSRLIVLAMVGLTALAALGLAYLIAMLRKRLGSSRRADLAAVVICTVACALSIAELAPVPFELSTPDPQRTVYEAVKATPPGAVAEYPLTVSGTPSNSEFFYRQRLHGRPLVNGGNAYTDADAVRRMLVDPGSRGTASSLALLGVTSIVTRPSALDWGGKAGSKEPASYGQGYRLLASDPSGVRAWQVTAAPAPAVAAYRGTEVEEPLTPAGDGFVGYPLTGSVVHVDVYAKSPGLWRLRFDTRVSAGGGSLAIKGAKGSVDVPLDPAGRIDVAIRVPRGHSALTLTVRRDGIPAGADPADVLLSGLWFEEPVAGDESRALEPARIAVAPGF